MVWMDCFKWMEYLEEGCVKFGGVIAAEDQTKFNDKSFLLSVIRNTEDKTSEGSIWAAKGFK